MDKNLLKNKRNKKVKQKIQNTKDTKQILMTFATVVFGSIIINSPGSATYTQRNSIFTGGFQLYIVPTVNIGSKSVDMGFTYVNQFGVQKTTAVTTPVSAGTTSGTHVKVVLEPGDTGVQQVISITINPSGGSTGDAYNLESWNEGLGTPAFAITLTDPFDRSVPGSHIPELYLYEFPGSAFDLSALVPDMYYSNPTIPVPITLTSSNLVAYFPELLIDRNISVREEGITKTDGTLQYTPEPTMRTFTGGDFVLLRSWLESVVGQVLSGYVTNINNQIIKNAFSLILISSTTTDVTIRSTTADVSPDTGLYQTFLKSIVYDTRYIIVKFGIKNIALQGTGLPTDVDGTKQLQLPYNLQFECPVKNCDFTITRK